MVKLTQQVKKNRFKKKIKKIILFYFLPFIVFIVFLIFLFNYEKFKIQAIDFKQEKYIFLDKKKIESGVKKILAEKYFYILNKNNYYFVPQKEILNKIIEDYQAIKEIKLLKKNSKIVFDIQEETVAYYYCQSEKKSKCFLMNKNGKIFSKIKKDKLKDKIVFYSSETKYQRGGKYFYSERERDNIVELLEKLKKRFGLKITTIKRIDDLYYILFTKTGGRIIVENNFTPGDVVLKLNKMQRISDLKIINGEFKNNLAYIVLFLEGRVNYCLTTDICKNEYR